MLIDLLAYEKCLYTQGIKLMAGVDEVGRGPLAGPLVTGAVILDLEKIFTQVPVRVHRNNDIGSENFETCTQINDSKLIPEKRRQLLDIFIRKEALSFSIFEVSHLLIDEIGLGRATQIAFFEVTQRLSIQPEHILTDCFAIKKLEKVHQTNIIHGDRQSISIAAASIIAKVYRDSLMKQFHKEYPDYGFDKHKGYGTKLHLANLKKFGPCPIHRKSFSPVKSASPGDLRHESPAK